MGGVKEVGTQSWVWGGEALRREEERVGWGGRSGGGAGRPRKKGVRGAGDGSGLEAVNGTTASDGCDIIWVYAAMMPYRKDCGAQAQHNPKLL